MSKLLPCPFCGGNDLSSGGDDKIVGYSCKTCQAAGPNHYGSHEWNTRPAPARCDELVTVAHRAKYISELEHQWRYYRSADTGFDPTKYEEQPLVTRQNAEEVIAAKDARIKELEAKLETANALVTCCCGTLVNDHGMGSGHSPVDQYHYAMDQLEAENRRLREALEPFADVADLDIGDDEDDMAIFWPISNERFSLARRLRVGDLRRASEALGEVKP